MAGGNELVAWVVPDVWRIFAGAANSVKAHMLAGGIVAHAKNQRL